MSEQIQAKFDLSIALSIASWPALTLAVQNLWGGPDSLEKRDWFAGAISELIEATPNADVEYVEEFMLQVMNDEFDVNVDDDSAQEVAAKILQLQKMTQQGDFTVVNEMMAKWEERQREGVDHVKMKLVENGPEDDTDWGSDGLDEDENEDTEMGDAPALVEVRKDKPPPEIDEEGFTKVVGKKKR